MFDMFFNKNNMPITENKCGKSKKEGAATLSKNSRTYSDKTNGAIQEGYCKLCKSNPCKCNNESALSKYGKGLKNATDKIKKKLDVRKSVKEALVSEVLYKILDESLGLQIENSNQYNVMKRNLVESYVLEKGAQEIMDKFQSICLELYDAQALCEEYVDKMVVFINEDDYFIDNDEKKSFYSTLKNFDFSNITDLVKARVTSAIDDFAQSNKNLKNDIQDMIKTSEEKINAATDDAVKESYERDITYKSNAMKDNKVKNIYEAMTHKIASASLLNESMSSYLLEGGRLDNHKIGNNVRVMYSFLEVVNTIGLDKVNDSYINDVLNSLE